MGFCDTKNEMTNPRIKPNSPHRIRRILIAAVVIVGACACIFLVVNLFSPRFESSETGAVASRTREPAGVQATSPVTRFPSVLETPSGGGGAPTERAPATATPQPTFAIVIGDTGELKFDYPLTLMVDKDDIVKVEIIPDQPIAAAGGISSPAVSAQLLIESGSNAGEHKTVSYMIPVYRVMSAELATARAQDLNIVAGSESKQMLAAHGSNFWTWALAAKRSGEYQITLRVFGYNELADADPVQRVVDDTRIITVQERSITERLAQGLADNWLVLFGAGGPIALVVLLLTFFFSRREAGKFKGGAP